MLLVVDIFSLITQLFLWTVVGSLLWYLFLRLIPPFWLTLLGGLVLFLLLTLLFRNAGSGTIGLLGDLILPWFFTPLGIVLLLWVTTLLGIRKGGIKKISILTARIALPLLLVASLPFVATLLSRELELEALRESKPMPEVTGPLVLLAADATRRANLASFAELPNQVQVMDNRVPYTAALYQDHIKKDFPLIVCVRTNNDGNWEPAVQMAEDTAIALRHHRPIAEANILWVRKDAITRTQLIPPDGSRHEVERQPYCAGANLHQIGERVKELLQGNQPPNRFVLVASALEMSRAVLTFEHLGLEPIARPTNFSTFAAPEPPPPEPSADCTASTAIRLRGKRGDGSFAQSGGSSEIPSTPIAPKPTSPEQPFCVPAAEAPPRPDWPKPTIDALIPSANALAQTTQALSEYLTSIFYFLRGWISPFRS
ncbi:hypothetical protein [Trichothermofontia sp.]